MHLGTIWKLNTIKSLGSKSLYFFLPLAKGQHSIFAENKGNILK